MASSIKPKREEKEKKEREKSRKEEEKEGEKMESFENKTFRGQSVLQKHSPLRIKKLLKMIIQKSSRSLSLLSKPLVGF
jgi:DNA replication protein DnaC